MNRRVVTLPDGTQQVIDNRTVSQAKAELREALSLEFQTRRDAGITVTMGEATAEIATHIAGRSDLSELVTFLERRAAGGENNPTQTAATRAGLVFTADLTTARTLRNAVADYVSKVWARDAVLTGQIMAATTIAEVDAVQIGTGWPSQDYTG